MVLVKRSPEGGMVLVRLPDRGGKVVVTYTVSEIAAFVNRPSVL